MPKVNKDDPKVLVANLQSMVNKLLRFEKHLSSLPETLDKIVVTKLQLYSDSIRELPAKYTEVMTELQIISSQDSDELLKPEDFFDQYIELISRSTVILNDFTSKGFNNETIDSSSQNTSGANAKLPRISLPIFDGDYTEFTSYYETFLALVHNNQNLTDTEKFIYLKTSLRGVAAQTIVNIQPSAENYKSAFDLLCERFNNNKLIILTHIKGLFELNVINTRNATDLRKLYDDFLKHIRALKNLSIPIEQCSSFIYYIIQSKLDKYTKAKFIELTSRSIPSLEELTAMLKQSCQTLEEIDTNNKGSINYSCNNLPTDNKKSNFKLRQNSLRQSLMVIPNKASCPICKLDHHISHCPKFLSLLPSQRCEKSNELKLCKNCLSHFAKSTCFSKHTCHICHKRHHTLLHFEQPKKNYVQNNETTSSQNESSIERCAGPNNNMDTRLSLSSFDKGSQQILLSTACVKIKSTTNKWLTVRVILDSGSHANFISERLADHLGLKRIPTNTQILGINSSTSQANSVVNVEIASLQNNFKMNLKCLTIPKICENLPFRSFEKFNLHIPNNIKLADKNFNISQPIELLIGVTKFYNLLCIGQISLGVNKPILQKTLLGWILSGTCYLNNDKYNTVCSHLSLNNSDNNLQRDLQKFWQLDHVEPKNPLSKMSTEERFCEKHFIRTVAFAPDGRFIVSIPFNSNLEKLGDSRVTAIERFLVMERKLLKNADLFNQYSAFIREYIDLGHMTKLSNPLADFPINTDTLINALDASISLSTIPPFYLPHHAVFKSNSLTTKLRVVFDGSAKSNTNISINDAQLVGPVVQNDLISILLRFRQHRIAMTGDIEKMYRQILINTAERKFQRIIWRFKPNLPIDTYELNTITYGTASASYLATKCLQHLSDLYSEQFPKASKILRTSFYMDDLLTGADTVEELLQIKNQICNILSKAGLPIRKFLSNQPELLTSSNSNLSYYVVPLGERENAKVLGLTWNAQTDVLQCQTSIKSKSRINSKRTILSMLSQIFDPLGLLSPIIVIPKLLIQTLWQLKISWDEGIPENLNSDWESFISELPLLQNLNVPRCVISENAVNIELHGFSDSSSKAFGACVYIRCIDSYKNIHTKLLCSKSRVAPLRNCTIPRLELCSAVLLVQLVQKIKESLHVNFHKTNFWSDSSIVLNWINSVPNKYHVFVANRIATIQEISYAHEWHYVPSKQNPADLISRGTTVSNLINNIFWWNGPTFLSLPSHLWPQHDNPKQFNETILELKTVPKNSFNLLITSLPNIFEKFSTLTTLNRIVAWMIRFVKNAKLPHSSRRYGSLQTDELQAALNMLIKLCQKQVFEEEIKRLKQNKPLKTTSNIIALNPFLDETSILRVGGRIRNSNYSYDKKFPIIIPKQHIFTQLIFRHFHEKLLHCGAQQLLAIIREYYWPISGRNTAKKITHDCIKCFRAKPISYNPLMADLPPKRLQIGTPVFSHVGVDYAGPVLIKDRKLRGAKLIKSYICLFICLVTKAIHLELVTSLTAEAFIAVLKRFISRRGKPVSITSDNGTNFIAAANDLKELYKFLETETNQDQITNFLANECINWEFNIPKSPHQGGIWESNVKSVKGHLKKFLGNVMLTYEDFSTVLIQIEAILNSRPLSPLSSDPSDTTPLTPGHFLISKPIFSLPEPNLDHINENRLSLYQRIQRITHSFWRRWSLEVVPEMQRRIKWSSQHPNLMKKDSLVLIKEENLPPLQWALGRVTEIHRSSDNTIRSVTLRIANGNFIKRCVHKLCVLPGV